jgi:hypothetical protein
MPSAEPGAELLRAPLSLALVQYQQNRLQDHRVGLLQFAWTDPELDREYR